MLTALRQFFCHHFWRRIPAPQHGGEERVQCWKCDKIVRYAEVKGIY
jgi:hypothetical protein